MAAPQDFSVVVTSYNYRRFIAEAIDSALMQSHAPSEVLVVDDGSTDGTPDLLRERYAGEPRVRLIEQPNAGQLAAFANGIRQVPEQRIVALLDADDLWEPNYLSAIADVYRCHPAVNFVYSNMRFFGSRKGLYSRRRRSGHDGRTVLLASFEGGWRSSATSAMSMRQPLAQRLTDLPAPVFPEWKGCADGCLALGAEILGAGKYYLGDALVRYRVHSNNLFMGRPASVEQQELHARREAIVRSHYRSEAGIDGDHKARHCRDALSEYLANPQVSRSDLQRYVRLVGASDLTPAKKRAAWTQMWARYLWRKLGSKR